MDPLLAAVAAVGAVCFLVGLLLMVTRSRSGPVALTERFMPYRAAAEERPTLADEAEDWLSRQDPRVDRNPGEDPAGQG